MRFFKELKEVEEVTGWSKFYYNFVDLERYDSMLMLNYLIDTEPIVKHRCLDDGYEDYLLYTDSFIQEKLTGVSPHLIKKMMDDLVKHDYILIHHADNNAHKLKYVKLNYSKLLRALGIKYGTNDGTNEGTNEPTNESLNNLEQNKITDEQSNKVSEYHYIGETSSPTNLSETSSFIEEEKPVITEPTPPPVEKPKRKSLKDQLTEYVNSLDYQQDTKDVLFKWIFTVGLPRKVRLEQLQDMLKDIWTQCNDESLVRQAINNAYLGNWFRFFPPNNKPTPSYKTPAQPIVTPSTPPQKEEARRPTKEELDRVFGTQIIY